MLVESFKYSNLNKFDYLNFMFNKKKTIKNNRKINLKIVNIFPLNCAEPLEKNIRYKNASGIDDKHISIQIIVL